HPNIVRLNTAMRVGELVVLAMEYVAGDDLARVVGGRGPRPVGAACLYARQVAEGLQHAHERGLVHRDIKPANLILARDTREPVVKILDFGLAKATREEGPDAALTGSGMMLGTPHFVAPEQTRDAAAADTRADVYSLGCTLYFLLTGRPPFEGGGVYEILHAHHTAEP